MPKKKLYYLDLPKFIYRYDTLDKLMFGYVLGARGQLPGINPQLIG